MKKLLAALVIITLFVNIPLSLAQEEGRDLLLVETLCAIDNAHIVVLVTYATIYSDPKAPDAVRENFDPAGISSGFMEYGSSIIEDARASSRITLAQRVLLVAHGNAWGSYGLALGLHLEDSRLANRAFRQAVVYHRLYRGMLYGLAATVGVSPQECTSIWNDQLFRWLDPVITFSSGNKITYYDLFGPYENNDWRIPLLSDWEQIFLQSDTERAA